MNSSECTICQGKGKIICDQCHGIGTKPMPFLGVFQSTVMCETCFGTGYIECNDCQGSGIEKDSDKDTSESTQLTTFEERLEEYYEPLNLLPTFEERVKEHIEENDDEKINILRLISADFELQQWILDIDKSNRDYYVIISKIRKEQELPKDMGFMSYIIDNLSIELYKRGMQKESREIFELKLLNPRLNEDLTPSGYTMGECVQDEFNRWTRIIKNDFKRSIGDAQKIFKIIGWLQFDGYYNKKYNGLKI